MDFSIDLSLDPASYMPVDLIGWVMQIVPAAFAVWTERSGIRFARVSYLISLILRVIGMTILAMIALKITGALAGMPTFGDFFNPETPSSLWTLAAVGYVMNILWSIVLVRALVRRMRDAGISQKWAYLSVLPFVDAIMFIGLIFYPPSRMPAPTEPAAA